MAVPWITLTTDFGEGSPYVAQMKAAVLATHPQARFIDITHAIGPQDVRHGAVVLADAAHLFPPGTIHVCVVDPGVGTERRIIYVACGDQQFVAPDNGLLSLAVLGREVTQIIAIESPRYWRQSVSATFHGRDIMAPVAAHLALGVPPHQLGPPRGDLLRLRWPVVRRTPGALVGSILLIDHFGNLITNIARDMLPSEPLASAVRVTCGPRACEAWVRTYGHADPGALVALFGSSGRLEIAVTLGSAAEELRCAIGDEVRVTWTTGGQEARSGQPT